MYRILSYISVFSAILPFIFGILKFQVLNKQLRILFIYIVVCLLTEASGIFVAKYSIKSYYLIQNIFTGLEYFLITAMYYIEFSSNRNRISILFISFAYLLFLLYFIIVAENYFNTDSISYTVESIILVVWSVYFFYKVQSERTIISLTQYPFFWVNCAVLIYFSTSSVLFLCNDFIEHCGKALFQKLWSLHLIGNIAYNCLFSVALWKTKSK